MSIAPKSAGPEWTEMMQQGMGFCWLLRQEQDQEVDRWELFQGDAFLHTHTHTLLAIKIS